MNQRFSFLNFKQVKDRTSIGSEASDSVKTIIRGPCTIELTDRCLALIAHLQLQSMPQKNQTTDGGNRGGRKVDFSWVGANAEGTKNASATERRALINGTLFITWFGSLKLSEPSIRGSRGHSHIPGRRI